MNDEQVFTVVVKVSAALPPPDTLVNTGTVDADNDRDPSNNTSTVETTVVRVVDLVGDEG